MQRKDNTRQALLSGRKHSIIAEIQRAVGRELAAQSELPRTMPQRIADLMRELHRRLRRVDGDPSPSERQASHGHGERREKQG